MEEEWEIIPSRENLNILDFERLDGECLFLGLIAFDALPVIVLGLFILLLMKNMIMW